jgi:ribonucleoside-triphosphate reductase
MKGIQFDNASQRKTYVGSVYEAGTKAMKEAALKSMDQKWAELHARGLIHLHDLEAYGQTYNCLTFNLLRRFPYDEISGYSEPRRIAETFYHLRRIVTEMGNEQSGGMSFANFDMDLACILKQLEVEPSQSNLELVKGNLESFINWLNTSHDRCGQVSYYVSLNLGLAIDNLGRSIVEHILRYFGDHFVDLIKPNIVFKVKNGVNQNPGDPNYDLFLLALASTCRKMMPTYLLCDSAPNKSIDPSKLAVMGCRTRVVQNEFGENSTIGRGNIAYVTINLPRIALMVDKNQRDAPEDAKLAAFRDYWENVSKHVRDSLLDRYLRLLQLEIDDFPCNARYCLWCQDFSNSNSLEAIFRNGTLSIGFIGLSEAVEILTGMRPYKSEKAHQTAIDLVKFMRMTIDRYRKETGLNFSLLATSGEYISGRFPEIDRQEFDHEVLDKGFYTNSFHVNVDSGLDPFQKLAMEGPFHVLCNGGSISYVEFQSAPISNTEAIAELVSEGVERGVSYLGFNFPMDTCRMCGETGVFDSCPKCHSSDVRRIRRVSGYLEDLEFFTKGKKAEVAVRQANLSAQWK